MLLSIGNAGWTRFLDFGDLWAASEEDWDKVQLSPENRRAVIVTNAFPSI